MVLIVGLKGEGPSTRERERERTIQRDFGLCRVIGIFVSETEGVRDPRRV